MRVRFSCLVVVLLSLFTSSLVAAEVMAEEPSSLKRVTLQLKWQHAFQFAGYYAAKAQGYYQNVGLDVRFVEGRPGVDSVKEVVSGYADFGVGTTELLLNRHQGAPVTILGAIYQHSPLQLVVLEETGIRGAADLVNKKIMMEQKASPEIRAFLSLEQSSSPDVFSFLKRAGVVQDRYQTVEHSHTLDPLLSKAVNAMTVYSTNQPFELNQRKIPYRLLSPKMSGIDFYGDNLFTTDYLIEKNPNLVRDFYHASMAGWRYALDHQEEVIDLIYREYGQRMTKEHLRYEAQVTEQLMQANVIQPGYMNLERWQHIVRVYQRLGDLPEDFSVTEMLYQEDEHKIKQLSQTLLWALIAFFLVSAFGVFFGYVYRRAQRSKNRLEMLLTYIPSAVMIIDAQGKIQLWNKGAERVFGWTEQEALREDALALLVPKAEQTRIAGLLDQVRGQEQVAYSKNANLHKDGHGLVCEWVNTPYTDGQHPKGSILCMVQDATKSETWQELVQEKAETEKNRFASLTSSGQLNEAIKQKLTHILALAQSMSLSVMTQDKMSEQSVNLLQDIEKSAQKGVLWLEQSASLSALESGKFQLHPELFSVQAVADVLAMNMFGWCADKALSFRYDYADSAPKVMTADIESLKRVLESLLDNALTFTHEGEVFFQVFEQDHCLCFAVEDTGIGMSRQQKESLFQYVAIKSEMSSGQGAGLSLSLAKSLMSAMGGSLDFTSQEGKGSRFWVCVPLT